MTGDGVYMDGSERHQPMLHTTTIEDADLKECLGNMGRTQVVERWCKVPGRENLAVKVKRHLLQ